MKYFPGFYKIAEDKSHSLVTCDLYDPISKEQLHLITDDTEHDYMGGMCLAYVEKYGTDALEYVRRHPIDEDALRQYQIDQGEPCVGALIEVTKGRKYPRGSTGRVTDVRPYQDRYGRHVAIYCKTDTGLFVDSKNVTVKPEQLKDWRALAQTEREEASMKDFLTEKMLFNTKYGSDCTLEVCTAGEPDLDETIFRGPAAECLRKLTEHELAFTGDQYFILYTNQGSYCGMNIEEMSYQMGHMPEDVLDMLFASQKTAVSFDAAISDAISRTSPQDHSSLSGKDSLDR